MGSCSECLTTELNYEFTFAGKHNDKMLPMLIQHVERNQCWVRQKESTLIVKEHSVRDLLDFFRDHMDCETIMYRIGSQDWRTIREINETLDSQWIDSIITNGRVVPYFQPIIDASGNVYAHEVLTRALSDDGSLIPPGIFFSAARKRNRIYTSDKLCRVTAVKNSIPNQKVFVNFLPTSIYSPEHCLKSTMDACKMAGITPSDVVFEVVETEKVSDVKHLKTILTYYKEHGFQYALDDVGEGYSTLELLKDVTPDYMKLDMKYIQGVSLDTAKQEMVKKALDIALRLDIIPLAEGIEDQEDFEYLKKLGYKLFQGYLFGRPSPEPFIVQTL